MTETAEFERVEYDEMDEGQSRSQYQIAANDLMVQPHCSTDSCTCKVEEPAESAWVKLMSAVPQANQISNLRAGREGTMMLPEGHTIQSMVASIRPQPEADYALDTIRDEWIDFYEELRIVGPKLELGLRDLSAGWKGEDYDAFEEQAETVIKNCRNLLDDIGGEEGVDGVIKVLDDKQAEIFEQQGGTACVYPAPKFYMEGTKCGTHRIHIRPPFFKGCVIEENDEIKHAVKLAGFDPSIIDEVHAGRQSTYDAWMERVTANPDLEVDGRKGEDLARHKADEQADRELVYMGAKGSEYVEEQAAIVNEMVTDRHSNVEAQVTEIDPGSRKSDPTSFNDGQIDLPGSNGLDIGGGGGMPDLGATEGLGDMRGPDTLTHLNGGLGDTGGLGDPGGFGGGFGGTGGGGIPGDYSTNGLNSLDGENPFISGLEDPDNLGGLNSLNTGGAPLTDYAGAGDLTGLDRNSPWSSSGVPDPEEISGGLAGGGSVGGTVAPPGGISTGGLSSGAGGGLVGTGPAGRLPGSTAPGSGLNRLDRTGRGTGSPGTGRGLTTAGPGRPGGLGGGTPGSVGRTSGLSTGGGRGGIGGGAGGVGGGTGGGRGGIGGGSGALGGRGTTGGVGMIPGGGAGSNGPGEEQPHERKVWMIEDDEVWGGSPEDEEDDPYA